jgi:hypothetical protein
MSMPEIDRLLEVIVLVKRKHPISYEDITWLCEEILRLREQRANNNNPQIADLLSETPP